MLCLVIDRGVLRTDLEDVVEASVAAGVDWVQVRERALEGEPLARLVESVQGAAQRGSRRSGSPCRVIVNRRCDVALACRADGVHLGFDALTPAVARELLGDAALLGRSLHAPEEIDPEQGLDYVHLAPIFPPLSKSSERPPLELAGLRAACGRGVPVLAQGGVGAEHAGEILAAGALGLAVTGAILMAEDPSAAARALRRALDA